MHWVAHDKIQRNKKRRSVCLDSFGLFLCFQSLLINVSEMLGGDIGLHTKRIEIYENERYSPLSGWSPKALLLTDRKALSNHDGSEGYNTIEEASQALISFGWQWDEAPWSIDKSPTINGATDEEGWTYSSDFTSFSSEHQEKTNISGTKGIMHFVRRRKLARNQSFDGKNMNSSL